jgi:AcrR family transcriptional regulator
MIARLSMGSREPCGISKSLIYHYYDSKEQLLFDILHSHLTTLYDGLRALPPAADPEAQLRQLGEKTATDVPWRRCGA